MSSLADDASNVVRETAAQVKDAFSSRDPSQHEFTKEECEDMLRALTPRQRKAFAALSSRDDRHPSSSREKSDGQG